MNFMMQAGMNQMKSQAQNLVPKEIKDATKEDNNETNEENSGNINDSSSNISNSNNNITQPSNIPKKKKGGVIGKALAIKMYTLLLIHTAILTIAEYIIHSMEEKLFSVETSAITIYWIIFVVALVLALLFSLMVSKIRCFSSLYFIYILYVVLLGLDLCIFNLGSYLISFDIFVSILIIFDAGCIVVLIFCSFIKEPPSSFWIMCSSTGGIILAIFLCAKLYEENRILVLVFGVITFVIYQVMNYNAFNMGKSKKKKGQAYQEEESIIPSAMALPYEFNASFIKIFFFFFEGIYTIITGCCFGKKKK